MATGFYVRAQRAGKWESLEIDELTDDELEQFLEANPSKWKMWAKGLARWIRDTVPRERERSARAFFLAGQCYGDGMKNNTLSPELREQFEAFHDQLRKDEE